MGARPAPQPGGLGIPPGAPVQVVPPGLLGLLQLKSLGSAPQQLSDQVGSVIELRDWYMTARRLDCLGLFPSVPNIPAGTLVTGATGFVRFKVGGNDAAVPQGQIWYVEEMTANMGVAVAADIFSFGLGLTNPGGNQFFTVGPISVDTVQARSRQLTAKADRGFWAFPGDVFGALVQDILSAAGNQMNLSIRATPMQL